MNWVDVTKEQIAAAEFWWMSRTPAEIEHDWPSPQPYSHRGMFACTGWRVFGGQERASIAMTLMDAGLICKPRRGRPVSTDVVLPFGDESGIKYSGAELDAKSAAKQN